MGCFVSLVVVVQDFFALNEEFIRNNFRIPLHCLEKNIRCLNEDSLRIRALGKGVLAITAFRFLSW